MGSDTVKISMAYDGDPERNPYKPPAGAEVAVCGHEPRPLYLNNRLEPIPTTRVYWANLCRDCHAMLDKNPGDLRLTVVVWPPRVETLEARLHYTCEKLFACGLSRGRYAGGADREEWNRWMRAVHGVDYDDGSFIGKWDAARCERLLVFLLAQRSDSDDEERVLIDQIVSWLKERVQ